MIKHDIDLAEKQEVCKSRRSLAFRWFISMRKTSGTRVCMGFLEDVRQETGIDRWRCENQLKQELGRLTEEGKGLQRERDFKDKSDR